MGNELMLEKIREMLPDVRYYFVKNYFDISSEEMLEKKIEILQRLIDGEKPEEIDDLESILELLPKEKNQIWD